MNTFLNIKRRWMQIAPDLWWGDSIDVRFYLISQLRKLRQQRVLDVGCNIGMMLNELDVSNIKHGFDIDRQVLRNAQTLNPTGRFVRCSLFAPWPYAEQSFDVVVMANVMPYHEVCTPLLEEAQQKTHAFGEAYRVLKTGGRLFLTTPNKEHLCYKTSRKSTIFELELALQHFQNIQIGGWNPLPSLVWFLPDPLTLRIPRQYHKYLLFPSPIAARMPGMMPILIYLMRKKSLRRKAKAFYVECQK